MLAAWWIPSFLSSWTVPAIAAAATIPPLILLYFLKLRRKPVPISSTFLWKRAVEDLQVNAPFQKLRNNLLLFLQLLILVLAILALWRPALDRPKGREKTLIFLIDQSASMSAMEESGSTRLELAKNEARRLVEAMGEDDRAMIIAFAEQARALGPFSGEKRELLRQVNAVEPTDALSRLGEAVALAKAHATPIGEGIGTPENPVTPAHLILLSDGQIEDAKEIMLRQAGGTDPGMEYVCIGRTADNVGVVGLEARRSFEYPEQLSVLARVRNFGPERVRTDLTLHVDDQLVSVKEVLLEAGFVEPPAGEEAEETGGGEAEPVRAPPGSAAIVEFDLELDRGGVVEARIERNDALRADNRAWAVVDAPESISLLVVSEGNAFLHLAVESMPLGESVWMTPGEYEQAPGNALMVEGRSRFDAVIFDAHSTERLPPGNYLFMGGVPLIEGVQVTGQVPNEIPIDWKDTHPVLRYIAFEQLRIIIANKLSLPRSAEILMHGRAGPILAAMNRDGGRYLIQSFALLDGKRETWNTPWLLRPGFPLYVLNAVRYLAGRGGVREGSWRQPGEAINIQAAAGRSEVTVRRPDGRTEGVPVRSSGQAYYGRTDRVGLYRAEGALTGRDVFAVSLCADSESDVGPRRTLVLGSAPVSGTSTAQNVTAPVWPWLLGAVLVVLALEWIVYNKRVFV